MATDPVCGMQVNEAAAKYKTVLDHTSYYFCCQSCLTKFESAPNHYLLTTSGNCCSGKSSSSEKPRHTEHNHSGDYICPMCEGVRQQGPGSCPKCGMALEPESPTAASQKTAYTCPMHPEVIKDEPGDCPKCGMALEATTIEETDNTEYKDILKRFIVGGLLALPVFIIAMLSEMAPTLLPTSVTLKQWYFLEAILATPVVFWAGWPFLVRAVQSLKTGYFNMFTLIGLGVSVAWTYSMVALLLPGIFPSTMQQSGTVPVFFEAAAVITVLVLLGQVLELKARSQTNQAISLLMGLVPKTARKVTESGQENDIPIEEIHCAFAQAKKYLSMATLLRVKVISMNPW